MAENKSNSSGSKMRTLELLYKPVFDIHLNMAIDYETSMRINDKSLGVLQEKTFVPVAEKSNRITQLNLWAVEEACEAFGRCAAREADMNSVIMWVSVKSMAKSYFVDKVVKIVDRYGLNHDCFCFKINESILEAAKEPVIANIARFRELGFRVAIDDLGLEYTSLSNLTHYDVDYIGIHSSLTEGLLTSEKVQNMLQGIIDFCKKIEAQVAVDGVNSKEMFDLLNKMGVDRFTGTYIGEPVKEKQIS